MEKKNYIITLGFIVVLIFFGIWFLAIIQKTPTKNNQPELMASVKTESLSDIKQKPNVATKLEAVVEIKPAVVVEPQPVLEIESAIVVEPKPVLEIKLAVAVESNAETELKLLPVVAVHKEPVEEVQSKPEPTVKPEAEAESAPTAKVNPDDSYIIPLEDQDCAKCHPFAVKDIDKRGGLHQSVGCSECHLEHPPLGSDTIPTCGMCHDPGDATHYNIKNCSTCHYPHYPNEMDFVAISSPACLSCHPDQGKEMEAKPSEHANLNCTECHIVHREWADCTECHTPHAEEMTHADCLTCHKPHSPKTVNYADSIPNNYCACCHEDVGNALASSKKAHSEMSCIECHESEHMAITQCDGCHDAKIHGTFMHERYPSCLECHNNPHALAE